MRSVIALLLLGVLGASAMQTCKRSWAKVGCFRDNGDDRIFPTEALNFRDSTNPAYNGEILQWNNFNNSLHSLACQCRAKALAAKYQYFGLQFWGECWIGPSLQYGRDGASNKCKTTDFGGCKGDDGLECVGMEFANYIYKVIEVAGDVVCSKLKDNVKCDSLDGLLKINDGKYTLSSCYKECDSWSGCTGFLLRDDGAACRLFSSCTTETSPQGHAKRKYYAMKDCQLQEKPPANNGPAVDGGWGPWSEYSVCDKKCGGGFRTAERVCNNPEPKNGGAYCSGQETKSDACNEEACEEVCKKQLDIGVVLDASGSVGADNYKNMLQFFVKLTEEFIISGQYVHFGAIHYSTNSNLDFQINEQTYWDPLKIKQFIPTIPYTKGGTRTDRALALANEKFFCSSCGRATAPKVLVVITDGKSSSSGLSMTEASKPLKDDGVKIIAIGVTSGANQEQLKEMASADDDVINIPDFKYMQDKLNLVLAKSCPKVPYFTMGDGGGPGNSEIQIANYDTELECYDACVAKKAKDNSEINAATYGVGSAAKKCWCEIKMSTITASTVYKTVYLQE